MRFAVLFDLDGTLVDHEAAGRSAILAWTRDRPVRKTQADEAMAAEWSRLETVHFQAYLSGQASFAEQRRRRLRSYLDFLGEPAADDAALDHHFEAYLRHYGGAWTAYADATPTLESLQRADVTLAVLTNGQEEQQRAKLAAVGLLDFFDHVIASSTLSAAKPAPGAFLEACARVGHPPDTVAYVGDNLHTDALAAMAAGLRGVWLNRGAALAPDSTPKSVTSLLQLPGALGLDT